MRAKLLPSFRRPRMAVRVVELNFILPLEPRGPPSTNSAAPSVCSEQCERDDWKTGWQADRTLQ